MKKCSDLCPEKSCPSEKLISLYPLTLDQAIQAILRAKRAERTREAKGQSKATQKTRRKAAE